MITLLANQLSDKLFSFFILLISLKIRSPNKYKDMQLKKFTET